VERAALDVGRRGDHEEHAGEQVDERREAERVLRDHAEREEDRGDDRAQHDREQRGLAERACHEHACALGAAPQAL
jgi:hypothetical protein